MSVSAQRVQLGPFFDQGELCQAALLYHYEPGSSTPKNIWSDQLMTIALGNPFVSDANGVFNFFADGYYKIVIQKSDGTLLYTLDNFKWLDLAQSTLSQGDPVSTASSMNIGSVTWAHWIGSNNVSSLSGTAMFYWAVADGSFTLIHSSNFLMPDGRNRKVLAGDALLFLNEGGGVYRLAAHMQKEGGWTGRQGVAITATATIPIPPDGDFVDITGGTTITAIAVASAGYRFRARFTGTGLNLTHNATSLIAPWGVPYRTIQNEILEFQSLGSGNWIFYSLNGPSEQTGQTMTWNGPSVPLGALPEDGAAVSRTTYAGLFAKISTFFGVGDGSTTFNVPDTRGRTEIMMDGTANRITSASVGGANADTLGGTGGAQTHTLVLSETPSKSVSYTAVRNVAGGVCAAGGDKGEQTNSLNVGGSDGAHNNMPPWIAKMKYIRF